MYFTCKGSEVYMCFAQLLFNSILTVSLFISVVQPSSSLRLRISSESFELHQTTIAANVPFDPPIKVELVNEEGALVRDYNSYDYNVTAWAIPQTTCISQEIIPLFNGTWEFRGSLCQPIQSAQIYFKATSINSTLETNLTRPIVVTDEIHIAYYQPGDVNQVLHHNLESFLQSVIHCFNSHQIHNPLKQRSIKFTTYTYDSSDPANITSVYLNMRDSHKVVPHRKAQAIIGMSNNQATQLILPLMTGDEYALTSFRDDSARELTLYPYFNRIISASTTFLEGVYLYLHHKKWTIVNLIYTGEDTHVDAVDASKHGIRVIKHKIKTHEADINYASIIDNVKQSGTRIIVTTVRGNVAESLMCQANALNVTSFHKFQWIGLQNEDQFQFILQNDIVNNRINKCWTSPNKPLTQFMGMIFINTNYIVDLVKESDFRKLWLNFSPEKHLNQLNHQNQVASFALLFDAIFTHINAFNNLISLNKTINAKSLSEMIRDNTNFAGATGQVLINPLTGNRDGFIANIYVMSPDVETLFSKNESASDMETYYQDWLYSSVARFMELAPFPILLLDRKENTIRERRVVTNNLFNFLKSRNKHIEQNVFNAHIPLTYWKNNSTMVESSDHKVNSLNSVGTIRCHGYFHNEYQIMIDGLDYEKMEYDWFWPNVSQETCQEELVIQSIPAPFFCESGCGGHAEEESVTKYQYGECIAHNTCRCNSSEWEGDNCTTPVCEKGCLDHGTCISPGMCLCSMGYNGTNCSIPICEPACDVNGGRCVKPDTCECTVDHYGTFCQHLCACGGEGKCNNGVTGDGLCGECNAGYIGEDCQWHWIVIMMLGMVVAGVSASVVIVISTLIMRKVKMRRAFENIDWLVEWDEITFEDDARKHVSAICMDFSQKLVGKESQIGKLNDIDISFQKIAKESLTLTREILYEIYLIRRMKHPNIVPLLGCTVEAPNVTIITELQEKGSLADIFANRDIKVPWRFRFSLMKDICKGLNYIHNSEIKSHGRLKSSNCLVDNKWTVKLSGFGLKAFRAGQDGVGEYYSGMTKEIKRSGCDYESLLWTSPEILIKMVYHIDHVENGTVNGDVYSFGMILSEFCTRNLPFQDLNLETPLLIKLIAGCGDEQSLKVWSDYLAKNNLEEGGWVRPYIPDKKWPRKFEVREKFQKLMQDCWDEDPLKRPTTSQCEVMLNQIDPQKVDSLDQLVTMLEIYSTNLENVVQNRHKQLQDEATKTEVLVATLLPKVILEDMKQGKRCEAKYYDQATIYCCELVGLSDLLKAKNFSPEEMMTLLGDIYKLYDDTLSEYEVFELGIVGVGLSFLTGVPNEIRDIHAAVACSAALKLQNVFSSFESAVANNTKLSLRGGVNTGSVTAGVLGVKMPHYCIFGDLFNDTMRLKENSLPGQTQVSNATFEALQRVGGFLCEYRHEIQIIISGAEKKTRTMKTYWLKERIREKNDDDDTYDEEKSAIRLNVPTFKFS